MVTPGNSHHKLLTVGRGASFHPEQGNSEAHAYCSRVVQEYKSPRVRKEACPREGSTALENGAEQTSPPKASLGSEDQQSACPSFLGSQAIILLVEREHLVNRAPD